MNRNKFGAMICCLALVTLTFAAGVMADDEWKPSIVTFSEPFEIPGVGAQILPAGTYVFRLMESTSNRNIVQILNESQDHVYSTILTIPNNRLQATNKTVITFAERPAGQPEAIKAWFYPGLRAGQEFVYPRNRATELAKMTNQPVLAMPEELAASLIAPIRSPEEPAVVALKKAPVEAVRPTGEVVAMTEVVELPPAQTAATNRQSSERLAQTGTVNRASERPQTAAVYRDSSDRLPQTAGLLPLLGLIGLLSIATGFGISVLAKRRV